MGIITNKIVFLHFPKAAGTKIIRDIKRNLSEYNQFIDHTGLYFLKRNGLLLDKKEIIITIRNIKSFYESLYRYILVQGKRHPFYFVAIDGFESFLINMINFKDINYHENLLKHIYHFFDDKCERGILNITRNEIINQIRNIQNGTYNLTYPGLNLLFARKDIDIDYFGYQLIEMIAINNPLLIYNRTEDVQTKKIRVFNISNNELKDCYLFLKKNHNSFSLNSLDRKSNKSTGFKNDLKVFYNTRKLSTLKIKYNYNMKHLIKKSEENIKDFFKIYLKPIITSNEKN